MQLEASKTILRRAAFALLAVLAPFLARGDAGAAASVPVRVAIPTDVRSSNPGVNRDAITDWVLTHVVEGLVGLGEDLEPKPVLARAWDISEDGRTYTFHLRDNVRFHNGERLTSAHVRWSFERYLDPRTRWLCRSWFDGRGSTGIHMLAVETPDAETVVIRLAAANRWFLTRLAHLPCLAAVVHPDSVSPEGEWLRPIGTGPYEWTAWQRGRSITLERFANYHSREGEPDGLAGAKPAAIDHLQLTVLPDATSSKLAMLAGELDVWPHVSPEGLYDLQRDAGIHIEREVSRDWAVLLLQNRDPALSDIEVRRALSAALDRGDVARSTVGHEAQPNATALPPELGAGIHIYEGGGPAAAAPAVELTLQVSRDNLFYFNDAVIVQDQLRRAGFDVALECLDWSTQFARYSAGRYQLSLMGFSGRPSPALMFEVFIGDKDRRPNVVVDDAAARRQLAQLLRAPSLTPDEERAALIELQQLVSHDASIIGLYNPQRLTAIRRGLTGYRTWALGTPRLWLLERAEVSLQ